MAAPVFVLVAPDTQPRAFLTVDGVPVVPTAATFISVGGSTLVLTVSEGNEGVQLVGPDNGPLPYSVKDSTTINAQDVVLTVIFPFDIDAVGVNRWPVPLVPQAKNTLPGPS